MKRSVSRLALILVSCALACAQDTPAAKPREAPLTQVQQLALERIAALSQELQQKQGAFLAEVCGAVGIRAEDCQIDPQRKVVAEKPKPAPAKQETKKP
jgi:hypothetical protein